MLGGAYVSQDVHPLQHPLHLPLLLGRELVEQRLQMARLCGKNTRQKVIGVREKREVLAAPLRRGSISAMDTRSGAEP